MSKETRFITGNDLRPKTREQMVGLLNQQLADTFDLYSQTKQAHWNVKGMNFIALHELFDQLAGELIGFVDMIAERATALGGLAQGTARLAAKASTLRETGADIVADKPVVEALAALFADYAKSTRAAIDKAEQAGDRDTADLFTEVSRAIDKDLWFLEAHLQK
jgi:starvation-inducible DNA-binding protein